ncbi:MAG: 6-carboxytetrahydropterin synthase [Phycisphaerales bacterium]|nr:6-carboxytetrahydropterin synthase [Phycisphaerales bacterium]
MVRLTREVRFSIDRDWAGHVELSQPITNSWGGWPSAVGIVPYLRLRATVAGEPNPRTGYLLNIRNIDDLLRRHAIPHTAEQLRRHGWRMPAERLLADVWKHLQPHMPSHAQLIELELVVTPMAGYRIRRAAAGSGEIHEAKVMMVLTQQFEFSAAHRLHCADLTDAENIATFGKCNNPNGHGHNYVVEVSLAGADRELGGVVFPMPRFEEIVQKEVIERLDHRHLNLDVPEFHDVNPSVENIARVIWRMLHNHFAPAQLHRVRVFETQKTWADYAGPDCDIERLHA